MYNCKYHNGQLWSSSCGKRLKQIIQISLTILGEARIFQQSISMNVVM